MKPVNPNPSQHLIPQTMSQPTPYYYHQVISELPALQPGQRIRLVKEREIKPPARFVETLRNVGLKVKVHHYRWVLNHPIVRSDGGLSTPRLARVSKYERKQPSSFGPPLILQNGGETHVTVQLPDGSEAQGVAKCSTADLYNKRLGVYLAAKRALKALKDARKTPVQIFDNKSATATPEGQR